MAGNVGNRNGPRCATRANGLDDCLRGFGCGYEINEVKNVNIGDGEKNTLGG